MGSKSYKAIRDSDGKVFEPWEITINGYLEIIYVYENGKWEFVKNKDTYDVFEIDAL